MEADVKKSTKQRKDLDTVQDMSTSLTGEITEFVMLKQTGCQTEVDLVLEKSWLYNKQFKNRTLLKFKYSLNWFKILIGGS